MISWRCWVQYLVLLLKILLLLEYLYYEEVLTYVECFAILYITNMKYKKY